MARRNSMTVSEILTWAWFYKILCDGIISPWACNLLSVTTPVDDISIYVRPSTQWHVQGGGRGCYSTPPPGPEGKVINWGEPEQAPHKRESCNFLYISITYRIVLNSRPGVYFLPEVLDPALI